MCSVATLRLYPRTVLNFNDSVLQKVITFCVEFSFSTDAKCYKILMIIFPAKYRLGEAVIVRGDVFCSNTSIISPDSPIF